MHDTIEEIRESIKNAQRVLKNLAIINAPNSQIQATLLELQTHQDNLSKIKS